MRDRWMIGAVVLLLAAGSFLAGQVVAQDEGGGQGGMQMPPWLKLTKEHEDLKKLAGSWDTTFKWQNGQQTIEDTGVTTAEVIFGGRFVSSTYKGTLMNMPGQGNLLLGFDTIDKEYVAVWIDSTSPLMGISRGPEKDGVVRMEGMDPDFRDPTRKRKGVIYMKWIDADSYRLDFFTVGDDGKENRFGEIVYKRRK